MSVIPCPSDGLLILHLQRPSDSSQEALQDVDDWDLTELGVDWEPAEDGVGAVGEGGEDGSLLVRQVFLL